MRFLVLLILLGTIAHGLPLRRGASLGYHVWRGWSGDSTLATLIVRDSTTTDSGIVWTLDVRDSLLSPGRDSFPTGGRVRIDSAQLLDRKTDTAWIQPSCLAAFDLTPYRGETITGIKGRGVLPTGHVSGLCLLDTARVFRIDKSRQTYTADASLGRSFYPAGPGAIHSASFPSILWVPGIGAGSVFDVVSKEEWKLRTIDGRAMTRIPRDSSKGLVTSLRIGESWHWWIAESTWESGRTYDSIFIRSGLLRWLVADSSEDSSGWIRRTILTSFPTSPSGDSTFQLRIENATGRATTTSAWNLQTKLAEGMWRGWADSSATGESWIRRRWLHTWSQASDVDLDSGLVEIAGMDGPRWLDHVRTVAKFRYSYHVRLKARLLEHNGKVVVAAVAPRRKVRSSVLGSVAEVHRFLNGRSGAIVRLTTISGRSETHVGSNFSKALRSWRGVVLIEIQDGDDITRGTLLIP